MLKSSSGGNVSWDEAGKVKISVQAILDVNGCFSFAQPEINIANPASPNPEEPQIFAMELQFAKNSYAGSLSD